MGSIKAIERTGVPQLTGRLADCVAVPHLPARAGVPRYNRWQTILRRRESRPMARRGRCAGEIYALRRSYTKGGSLASTGYAAFCPGFSSGPTETAMKNVDDLHCTHRLNKVRAAMWIVLAILPAIPKMPDGMKGRHAAIGI